MCLLTSLFLLPVLQGRVLQNHEASPWKSHENTTAVRVHQSAQWGRYLEKVNFLHVLYVSPSANYISQPLPLHKTTVSSPAAGDHAGAHGSPPPHPVPPAPQKDTGAPSICPLTPPRRLAFTRVVTSTVYLHRLTTEMLSISGVTKPPFPALTDSRTEKSSGLMPLNIYQTAMLTVILQFPQVFL